MSMRLDSGWRVGGQAVGGNYGEGNGPSLLAKSYQSAMANAAYSNAQMAAMERATAQAKEGVIPVGQFMSGPAWDEIYNRLDGLLAPMRSAELAVAVAEPVAIPERVDVVAEEGATIEYLELAASIGLESPAVLDAQLKLFMEKEHIRRYGADAVMRYMDDLVNRESAKDRRRYAWGWYPLRKIDQRSDIVGWATEGGRRMQVAGKVYSKAVPKVPLETVKKIWDAFGKAVAFFVTDYEARRPDPFLGVAGVGTSLYIVERWNEPGFRDV